MRNRAWPCVGRGQCGEAAAESPEDQGQAASDSREVGRGEVFRSCNVACYTYGRHAVAEIFVGFAASINFSTSPIPYKF